VGRSVLIRVFFPDQFNFHLPSIILRTSVFLPCAGRVGRNTKGLVSLNFNCRGHKQLSCLARYFESVDFLSTNE
jgi:hypothetical protein